MSATRVQPCPCEYWVGEDPETAEGTPMAIYCPETGALNCVECGAELQSVDP